MKIFLNILFMLFAIKTFSQYLIIRNFIFEGNKKTKPFIIERELTFKKGDTLWLPYLQKNIEQSKQNLLKTSLFNFAEIDTINSNNKFTDILISVVERWYLWPIPVFEQASRNINTWFYEKDYDKINYGFFIAQANFRGRNELLRAIARLGYREQYGFAYTIPHILGSNTTGVEIKALYYRQKQLAFKNEQNKPIYLHSNNYLYTNSDFTLELFYRPKLYALHSFEISYSYQKINDSLFKKNPHFLYDTLKINNYTSLSYYFRYDKTNSVAYPTFGYYFDYTLANNILFSKKTYIPQINIKGAYYYTPFKRFFNSHGIVLNYSHIKKQSYLMNKAFGYRTSPRGYELYLIDGQGYLLSQNSIRYMLIKPRVKTIYKLKNERFAKFHYAFYLSLNGDVGYVLNRYKTPLTNQLLYGYGVGIDFVTYYDITLRTEFSINHLNIKGVFFHFSSYIK